MTDTNTAGLKALQEYLKDCDAHAIVPDVGGAWQHTLSDGREIHHPQRARRLARIPSCPRLSLASEAKEL